MSVVGGYVGDVGVSVSIIGAFVGGAGAVGTHGSSGNDRCAIPTGEATR